jgi:hypothetical protein
LLHACGLALSPQRQIGNRLAGIAAPVA